MEDYENLCPGATSTYELAEALAGRVRPTQVGRYVPAPARADQEMPCVVTAVRASAGSTLAPGGR